MFVNKNPINSHSIPLGVMPDLAGYSISKSYIFILAQLILDNLKRFLDSTMHSVDI